MAPYYVLKVPGGEERTVKLRITDEESVPATVPIGVKFDEIFQARLDEADDFYDRIMPKTLGPKQKVVSRQAYAGRWTIMAKREKITMGVSLTPLWHAYRNLNTLVWTSRYYTGNSCGITSMW